ncbi:MAG: sodium:solute symporter [Verrucomicrobiales bacterium]
MSAALIVDGGVVLAYFVVVMSIGLAQRSKSGSMEGFALGDRQIAWWAVLASILAAEISGATFFGAPGEGYALRNFTYVQLIIGYILARVFVSAFFIPAYYRHNVVSIYEFLEHRFGPRTRRLASAVFLVTRALASGTRLWVPTILLVIAWKLFVNPEVSPWQEFWLYAVALVLITLLTAIYTAIGGIRAVVWTDVIQVCVLFGALGFSLWFLLGKVPGGWDGVKAFLSQPEIARPDDLKVFSWGHPDPAYPGLWGWIKGILEQEYTLWAAFLGSTFVTLATHGTDQDMVQRMLTAKNKNQSAVATILSGIVDVPVVFVVLAIGILLHVFYHNNPDASLLRYLDGHPNPAGAPKPNEIFPQFVLTQMPAGLRGLVIAGLLAATMGSLGTALNALSTSYVRDFHFRWFGEPGTDAGRVRVLRLGTVGFAVILIAIGLATAGVVALQPSLRILPIVLGIFGYTYGSLLGVFMVGLFTRRGNCRGNLIAMISGFVAVAYLSGLDASIANLFGGKGLSRPGWMPVIEFPWRILFGSLVTFLVAVLFKRPTQAEASAMTREMEKPRLAA